MSNAELRDLIGSFSFQKCKRGSQGFRRVLLQLFGFLGHGKSSFINTCKYVWEDMGFSNIAKASDDDEGHTMVRITYPLTQTITLVDNRGFCKMGSYETGEIFAQLGNLLPLDTPVEWNEGFGLANRIVEAENLVKVSDFIVPIFLYSAKKGICAEDEDELLELIVTARDLTGVYPIVVLTDKSSEKTRDVTRKFKKLGVERIFALENYTLEDHRKSASKHQEVLRFLYEVIKDVEFQVGQPRNPEEEMTERKTFVLRYIHHNDLKIQFQRTEMETLKEQSNLKEKMRHQREKYEQKFQEDERKFKEEMRKLEEEFEAQKLHRQPQSYKPSTYKDSKSKKRRTWLF